MKQLKEEKFEDAQRQVLTVYPNAFTVSTLYRHSIWTFIYKSDTPKRISEYRKTTKAAWEDALKQINKYHNINPTTP